jgi:hypothetical protein
MRLFLLALFVSSVISTHTCLKVIGKKVKKATEIKVRIKAVEKVERALAIDLDKIQHERFVCRDPANAVKLDKKIETLKKRIAETHKNKQKVLQELRGALAGLPPVDQAHVIRQVRMEKYVHIYPFLVQHFAKNEMHSKDGAQMFMSEAAQTKQLVDDLNDMGVPAMALKQKNITDFEFAFRGALRKGSEMDERIHLAKMDYLRGLSEARVIRERTERVAAQWRDEMLTWKDEQICDYEVRNRILGFKTKLRVFLKQARRLMDDLKEKRKALQIVTMKKVKKRITALELLKTEFKMTPDQRSLVDKRIDSARKIGKKIVPKEVGQREKKEQVKEFELVKQLEQLSLKSNAFTGKICAKYLDVLNIPREEFLIKMQELDALEKMIARQTKERMARMSMMESKRNERARALVIAQAKLRNKMRKKAMENLREEVHGEVKAKEQAGNMFLRHIRDHQHIPKELKVPVHPLDRYDYDRKFRI